MFVQRLNIRTPQKFCIAREDRQPVYPADLEKLLRSPILAENNMIAIHPRIVIILDRFSQGEPGF